MRLKALLYRGDAVLQVYALTGGLPPIMPTFDIKSLLKKRPASKHEV